MSPTPILRAVVRPAEQQDKDSTPCDFSLLLGGFSKLIK
jgi:hypothetical protein